jgi:hypothetical protein
MNTSDARSRRKAPFLENPSNPDDLVIAGFQPFEAHRVGSFEPAASVCGLVIKRPRQGRSQNSLSPVCVAHARMLGVTTL